MTDERNQRHDPPCVCWFNIKRTKTNRVICGSNKERKKNSWGRRDSEAYKEKERQQLHTAADIDSDTTGEERVCANGLDILGISSIRLFRIKQKKKSQTPVYAWKSYFEFHVVLVKSIFYLKIDLIYIDFIKFFWELVISHQYLYQ